MSTLDFDSLPRLIGQLVKELAAFAATETQIERDCRIRTSRLETAFTEAFDQLEPQFKAACAAAKQDLEDRRTLLAERYDRRGLRAQQAHRRLQSRIEEDTEAREGSLRNRVQEAIWVNTNAFNTGLAGLKEVEKTVGARLNAAFEALRETHSEVSRIMLGLGLQPLQVPEVKAGDVEADLTRSKVLALSAAVQERMQQVRDVLADLRGRSTVNWCCRIPFWVPASLILLLHLAVVVLAAVTRQIRPEILAGAGISVLVWEGVVLLIYRNARKTVELIAGPLYQQLTATEARRQTSSKTTTEWLDYERNNLAQARDSAIGDAQLECDVAAQAVAAEHHGRLTALQTKYDRLVQKLGARRGDQLAAAEADAAAQLSELKARFEADSNRDCEAYEHQAEAEMAAHEQRWQELVARWQQVIPPLFAAFADARRQVTGACPPWSSTNWRAWTPPDAFPTIIPYGRLQVDLAQLVGNLPMDERLSLPTAKQFEIPAALVMAKRSSLLIEHVARVRDQAVAALQNVMLRLLTSMPPGKVGFTLIDPVGLGQSFAGFMHLVDFEESLVGTHIWTDSKQIEQRLADLNEHIETVIQKYLRNDFESISQYNASAGEMAERYRFVVIADFPHGFTETAVRRLYSVVNSGARCGVSVLISYDRRQQLPASFEIDELRRKCVHVRQGLNGFVCNRPELLEIDLQLDAPPDTELLKSILQQVGKHSQNSQRVEVPFDSITPAAEAAWTGDSAAEVRVALGRRGATRLQELSLGRDTAQHVLVAGKTGSGKSTLFHVLITNLALWYSPEQIEFYLIDFKKGVEFKAYAAAQLPHARAVAIESDREFGLSVLQRIDSDLKERGERFRDAGVQDLKTFRKAMPEPMPRIMLIIDEFQEFFTEDDRVAQDAALLLDRIVRQGRAFGIHVLLGTQTLAGAYTLARSTLGQMAVRIALQCSDADSYLILHEDNAAARLLSRPGEAIYNDAAGLVEGNSPFQVAWLSDEERDQSLRRAAEMAAARDWRRTEPLIVFEGNMPAAVAANTTLTALLAAWPPAAPAKPPSIWIGEPNTIKAPTSAAFPRYSGSNLLAVGQRDETARAMLSIALISLAAQHQPDGARFVVLDGTSADAAEADHFQRLAEWLPQPTQVVAYRDVPTVMDELAAEVARRQETVAQGASPVFVLIHGLQRFRQLRSDDDAGFSFGEVDAKPTADAQFRTLMSDGPELGLHLIVWCDTFNNVNRTIARRGLRDFEVRLLFQMSAADSSNLMDSPEAANLGLHAALLFNEQAGTLEKFRPYALPDDAWLAAARAALARV